VRVGAIYFKSILRRLVSLSAHAHNPSSSRMFLRLVILGTYRSGIYYRTRARISSSSSSSSSYCVRGQRCLSYEIIIVAFYSRHNVSPNARRTGPTNNRRAFHSNNIVYRSSAPHAEIVLFRGHVARTVRRHPPHRLNNTKQTKCLDTRRFGESRNTFVIELSNINTVFPPRSAEQRSRVVARFEKINFDSFGNPRRQSFWICSGQSVLKRMLKADLYAGAIYHSLAVVRGTIRIYRGEIDSGPFEKISGVAYLSHACFDCVVRRNERAIIIRPTGARQR